MSTCPSCRHALPATSPFCPTCGADQSLVPPADADLTIATPVDDFTMTSVPTATAGTLSSTTNPAASTRFVPGAMVTDRYRIVGLLGRGGMGEVYRADDLKLGQPVALKFLPVGLEHNPDRLQRFLAEVRLARQVTHPNVCRVYDIEEVDGQHFLSMEYVDGEDLSSLLLRIGRLPQERAVEVARQICAGLAAAHDQGILHRDLKPANVMIDGRGRVRLTDFGLAGIADEITGDEIGIGTPAYMAPEQIAGQGVSVRSDIYALGLVLYEIFTGRRTFEADTLPEMQRLHTSAVPSNLTQFVQDLDPTVERAVLRCLEKNPADRPATVLAVSAALPGGDPLAAALAAGETPSPELMAEVGVRQGLAPIRAFGLALLAVLLLVGGTRWAGTMTITNFLPLDRRPEVLEDLARGMIAELGYKEDVYADPVDHAWGVLTWYSVIAEVGEADTTDTPWAALNNRPDAVSYWYRQSPRVLLPIPNRPPIFQRGVVGLTNPQPLVAGEAIVLLDGEGRLRRFQVVPTRYSLADTIVEPDWQPLFDLAGLDMARFNEDRPRYQRFMTPDRRRAWVGTHADRPDVPMRVEAGSYEGRPVLFNVSTVASMASLGATPERQTTSIFWIISSVVQPMLILLVVVGSVRVAKRNMKQGRADRRGALRFGALTFFLFILSTALESHGLTTKFWADEIWPIIVGACFVGLASWSLYTSAEPMGRQVWPTMFVSSSRLLSRPRIPWRDPLIGYSLLIGLLAGGLDFLIKAPLGWILSPLWSGEIPHPYGLNSILFLGQRHALAIVLDQSLLLTLLLVYVVALVGIRKLIKRRFLAMLLTLVVWTVIDGGSGFDNLIFSFISSSIMMVVLLRWGVVAMITCRIVTGLAWSARIPDWSAWHAEASILVLSAMIILTVYAAWAAVGTGQEQS